MVNIKIYDNVIIGQNTIIEDFCIIGSPPRGKNDGELITIIGNNCIIRSHSVIYAGNKIGNNFQCGHHLVMREDNIIGDDVSIGSHSNIEHHITIKSGARLHSNVFVPEFTIIENMAWIGPNVVFTNARYPNSKNAKKNLKGVMVSEGAKIGANATILPGIQLGKNSLIGAGSVITRDVDDGSIVIGNPGRVIGQIGSIKDYRQED